MPLRRYRKRYYRRDLMRHDYVVYKLNNRRVLLLAYYPRTHECVIRLDGNTVYTHQSNVTVPLHLKIFNKIRRLVQWYEHI